MTTATTNERDTRAARTTDEARARRARRLPFDTESRGTRWLAGLFGAQLLVAGALAWQGARDGEFADAGPLLAFDREALARLTIVDGTGESPTSLALVRDADAWHIETGDDDGTGDGDALPADATRVDGVLETLAALEAALPVASAERSRAQLDVAEDDFQRRVTLDGPDGTLADLYIGTSPGFRRAHVRTADGDAIRALEINVFDLPVGRDDWLEKSMLAVPDPTRIAGEDFVLSRDGEDWTLDGETPTGRVLSTDAAAALADALADLRVSGVADVPDDGAAPAAPLVLTVSGADGTARTLTVEAGDTDAIVRRDDRDTPFTLPAATRERLLELATLDALLVDAPRESEDASGTSERPGTEGRSESDGDSPSG